MTHEPMTTEGVCPRCGERCERDRVDVGVGIITGPWGCSCCGWSEDPAYDAMFGGGFRDNGGYLDPMGGLWPVGNPVTVAMRAARVCDG